MIREKEEIGDFDTVLTRGIDGSPVCRSVDNFDIRRFKGLQPVYLTQNQKVYPDPDQKWDDLESIVQQSWKDFYNIPLPEKERQYLLTAMDNNRKLSEKQKGATPKQETQIPGYNVYDRSGRYLFSLGNSRHPDAQDITTRELYAKELQWFAPSADSFIPMDTINPDIVNNPGVLHIDGDDIYKFANGRHPLDYGSGGPGDWKVQPTGGKGYILAEIGGLPYWVDGLGQIPYAIDTYRYFYKSPLNRDRRMIKELSGDFASEIIPESFLSNVHGIDEKKWTYFFGRLFGSKGRLPDFSNSYDNYMIRKTLGWYENNMLPYERNEIYKKDRKKYWQILDLLFDYGYDFRK